MSTQRRLLLEAFLPLPLPWSSPSSGPLGAYTHLQQSDHHPAGKQPDVPHPSDQAPHPQETALQPQSQEGVGLSVSQHLVLITCVWPWSDASHGEKPLVDPVAQSCPLCSQFSSGPEPLNMGQDHVQSPPRSELKFTGAYVNNQNRGSNGPKLWT